MAAPSSVGGVPYNCTLPLRSGQRLSSPRPGARYNAGIIGGIIGGNGQTGREGRLLSIQPEVQRYNANLLAHYKFSDAFEVFAEAKWNRVDARRQQCQPDRHPGHVRHVRFPRTHPARQPVPDAGAADPDRQPDPYVGLQHQPDRGLRARRESAAVGRRAGRRPPGKALAARSTRPTSRRSTPVPTAS